MHVPCFAWGSTGIAASCLLRVKKVLASVKLKICSLVSGCIIEYIKGTPSLAR